MKDGTSLEALERSAYLKYHRDGLVDLGIGGVILLFGLGMQYDQTLLAPIFACVAYPVWLGAKKGITEKRYGYVEFSEERKKKERKGMAMLFILGCLTFVMGILAYKALTTGSTGGGFLRENGYMLIGVIFALLSSSIGAVLGVLRIHAYSCLVLASIAGGHLFGWPEPVGVIVPGALIILSGLFLLVSFIRAYPLEPEGVDGTVE